MKKFIFEFRKFKLRSKAIYWTLNISIAWLEGLFFSIFVKTDYEKIIIISGMVITSVILLLLLGGYKNERRRFESKYADLLKRE
jgi:hypothetical protein